MPRPWVLHTFITSTRQQPESSEVFPNKPDTYLRSERVAFAVKTQPKEVENPDSSGGSS